MASKTTFQALYNNIVSGLFKTNTTKDIGSDDMRSLVDSITANNPFTDDDSYTWASPITAVAGTTTLTGTPSPVITAYATGQVFKIKAGSTTTGSATLNFSSIGAKKLYVTPTVQAGGGSLVINTIYIIVYDATLDSAAGGFLIIGSSLSDFDSATPSTAGGTITFDLESKTRRVFVGSASFGSAKTIALSNNSNALEIDFILDISNVAAILTFPSSFLMSDVRWEATGAKQWEPDSTGKFKGHAIFNGTNWLLDITNPYV